MPLIPNDDPAALAELLGYLDEIGYGELYLGRPSGTADAARAVGAAPVAPAGNAANAANAANTAGVAPAAPAGGNAGDRATASRGDDARADAHPGQADAGDPGHPADPFNAARRAVEDLAEAARAATHAAVTAAAPVLTATAGAGAAAAAMPAAAATWPAADAPAGLGEVPGAGDAPARAAALAALAEVVAPCRRCRLCEGRNKTVFGSGDPNADLMFIGEGPGAEEDKQGLPFVGRAGELLTKIIAAIDLTRDQVYIANIVKCRPPGNRDPQPDEVAACRPYLEKQIALVRPRFMVALGRIAAQTLLGNDLPIGRMRGQWFDIYGVPTMVTYHPAALLRNPALKRPTWEDLQQVRDRLLAPG